MTRWGEVIVAVALIILGIGFAGWGGRYGLLTNEGVIGPGFLPFVAGIMLAVFAGINAVKACWQQLKASRTEKTYEATGELSVESGEQRSLHTVLLVFALLLAAILLAPIIGFLLSFGLLVLVLVAFVERDKLWLGLLISISTSVAAWLIFVELLNVPVPEGFLQLVLG